MKRKLFFLKDTVSGNFYGGEGADELLSFDKASVYWQRKNAEEKIKRYVKEKYTGSWGWYEKIINNNPNLPWGDEMVNNYKKMIAERKNLPNWGIEIVEVEIDAP